MPDNAQVIFEVIRVETWEGDEGVVTLKPLRCVNQHQCDEMRIVAYVGRWRGWTEGQRLKLTDAKERS